jgi:uncharacterized membrane protein YtjA (UPF0391 family)
MLYFALTSLTCALAATLLGYSSVAIALAQLGELLFVCSALMGRQANARAGAMAPAMG